MRLKERKKLTADLREALLHGPDWMFVNGDYSEARLREAWEAHGDESMSSYRDEPGCGGPGFRPWGWWKFEAQRDEHLADSPIQADDLKSDEELGRALDEYEFEPILFLARNGHLTSAEVQELRYAARAAERRINTGHERRQSGAISKDRSAVRLDRAVSAALDGDEPETDYGVPYMNGRPT